VSPASHIDLKSVPTRRGSPGPEKMSDDRDAWILYVQISLENSIFNEAVQAADEIESIPRQHRCGSRMQLVD